MDIIGRRRRKGTFLEVYLIGKWGGGGLDANNPTLNWSSPERCRLCIFYKSHHKFISVTPNTAPTDQNDHTCIHPPPPQKKKKKMRPPSLLPNPIQHTSTSLSFPAQLSTGTACLWRRPWPRPWHPPSPSRLKFPIPPPPLFFVVVWCTSLPPLCVRVFKVMKLDYLEEADKKNIGLTMDRNTKQRKHE